MRVTRQAEQASIYCPVCSLDAGVERVCPGCGEDLSLLYGCQMVASMSYSLGLDIAQEKRRHCIEHARECLRVAAGVKGDFAEAYILLGKLCAQDKQYGEAIACWKKALGISHDSKEAQDCLNDLGDLNLYMSGSDSAMACKAEQLEMHCPVCNSKTTTKICPKCSADLSLLYECQSLALKSYRLGLYLGQKHRSNCMEQAKKCLGLATALRGDFAEAYILLGKLYERDKQYYQAIACWNKALSINHESNEAQSSLNALGHIFGRNIKELRLQADWWGKPVRLGSTVQCADGKKGMVWRLIPGNKGRSFSHIVVSLGRRVVAPIELITNVNGEVVFIGLRSDELLSRMPRYLHDERITDLVSSMLLAHEPLRAIQGMVLDVTSEDGIVALSGNVRTYVMRKKAEELAMSVNGVLAVHNHLICDSDLELTVARAIASGRHIRWERVFIKAALGVVSLEGIVKSAEARKAIVETAWSVIGVKGVVDRLAIDTHYTGRNNNGGEIEQ